MRRDIDPVSLPCRDMRHAWMPKGDNVLHETIRGIKTFSRTLECFRCGTTRTDTYEVSRRDVTKVRTGYTYPKGYHVTGGLPVSEARFMLFRNAPMKKETAR